MHYISRAQQIWAAMTPADREKLLKTMAKSIPEFDISWWEGKSAERLAEGDFSHLPKNFTGPLALSVTEKGFSVEEYERVVKALSF